MDLLCILGRDHSWLATGLGYFMWASADTESAAPINAPYVRQEICMMCEAMQYVPATSDLPHCPVVHAVSGGD
jgi:hypothetical protein